MTTSRISRGCHRTGIVVALPILLLAAALAGHEEWLQRTTQDPGQYHVSFGTPLRLLGLAIILYAAARAIGRVFDGFASTSRAEARDDGREILQAGIRTGSVFSIPRVLARR